MFRDTRHLLHIFLYFIFMPDIVQNDVSSSSVDTNRSYDLRSPIRKDRAKFRITYIKGRSTYIKCIYISMISQAMPFDRAFLEFWLCSLSATYACAEFIAAIGLSNARQQLGMSYIFSFFEHFFDNRKITTMYRNELLKYVKREFAYISAQCMLPFTSNE